MVSRGMNIIAVSPVKLHTLKGAAEALIALRMAAHSPAPGSGGGLGEKPLGTRVIVVPAMVSADILDRCLPTQAFY